MPGESGPGLRRDAIGLREVLFQSITAMAPAAAVAASIPSGAAFAGGSLPLSVLVALVACLFTASCVAELARRLPAAGSVATYSAQGLHPAVGFLVGWGYVFVEALVPALLLLQLGFTTAGTLHQEWAGYPAALWWPWSLAGAVVIALAGFYGVRASARLGTVLGVFEVLVLLVFAVLLIVRAGDANTLSVFGTSHTAHGYTGVGGVFAGSVYTVLAFSGFEAAAPLAEETRDPRRTMRRAVLGAALAIGLFYVLTTYAMSVYFGPDRFAGFGVSGASSWEGVARASFGLFWVLLFLAVVNSTIANANACANVSTRTAFALGRAGVFPRPFARIHPRHRSPVTGVAAQFAVAVAAVLGLGLAYGPETAFALLATVIVTVVIGVYIVVNLACAGYFLRRRRDLFRPVPHLLFPVLGIAAFVPALLTAAGIPAFDFVSRLAPPVSYAGPVVGGWMLAGAVVLAVLVRRHPGRLAETGRIHLDGPALPSTGAGASGATGPQRTDSAAGEGVTVAGTTDETGELPA
ncbi:APC family permease [Streptomyces sp. SID10853]|uniref:APC family permease n=1 Tax=Streptomyces sp. SID10853 TaxID=2706028 RepID=UPI0013C19F2D|nr:APC family permease [Streptomyces sp. SID10853]NDZ83494.1 APC family permease [Streptomyces sp. SID10853]